jgi:DNA polymerase-3 subunit alpha
VKFEFGHLHLPDFHAPDGMTNQQYLRKLCNDGLHERYDNYNGADFSELEEINKNKQK